MRKLIFVVLLIFVIINMGCYSGNSLDVDYVSEQPNWSIKTEEQARELYPKYASYIDECFQEIGLEYSEEILCNHSENICSNVHDDCFYTKRYTFSSDLLLTIHLRFKSNKDSKTNAGTYLSLIEYRYGSPKEINLFPNQIFSVLEKIEYFCCWGVAGQGLNTTKNDFKTYSELFQNSLVKYSKIDFEKNSDNSFSYIFEMDGIFTFKADRFITIDYVDGWILGGGAKMSLTDENIV